MLAQELITRFVAENRDLKTLPIVLAEIIRITANPNSDAHTLEDVLRKDPVIAGKIMKMANSSFYGRRVDNLRQAFMNIGWEAVKAIALSTTVVNCIAGWDTKLDRARFWRHSLEVAVTSRSLARRLGMRFPETNYTIGLLHDIGILVLDQIAPGKYADLFDIFMPDDDLAELERQIFGTDHCEVGTELLKMWNLPGNVWTPICEHHLLCRGVDDDLEKAQKAPATAILSLADQISILQFRPIEQGVIRSSQRLHLLMKACGLMPDDIIAIRNNVTEVMVEEADYLDRSVGNAEGLARQAANALLEHLADLAASFYDLLDGEIRRAEKCPSEEERDRIRQACARDRTYVDRICNQFKEYDRQSPETPAAIDFDLLNHSVLDFIFRLIDYVVTGTSPSPDPKEDTSDHCLLFFGTNREPEYADGHGDRIIGYGEKSCGTLRLGTVTVCVPHFRRPGSLGAGPIGGLIWPEDKIFVEGLEELSPDLYWNMLTDALKTAVRETTPDLLVYIHGYFSGFDRAARRAAQLHVDLHVRGATAFFSWPSSKNAFAYFADMESVQESAPYLREFLSTMARKCRPAYIHIIAHSLGNRALLSSIEKVADEVSQDTGIPFAQIILAAPDVTVNQFKAVADAYRKVSLRTTIYVSQRDRALKISRLLRLDKTDILGSASPIVTFMGLDTVEATRVDNTFMGHHYYCGSGPVLSDISELINQGTPPEKRPNIYTKHSERDDRDYYVLQENENRFKPYLSPV